MKSINLLFPHHLFQDSPLDLKSRPVFLVEEFLFFRQYAFHQQKIAFHRASMKAYAEYLEAKGAEVVYVESTEDRSDLRKLIPALADEGVKNIYYIDPVDDWLQQRLESGAKEVSIQLHREESPLFINQSTELEPFFRKDKKKFYQTDFYTSERKRLDILLEEDGKPVGGKWSFDADNRKKYPKDKTPPEIHSPKGDKHHQEAREYVEANFSDYPGALPENPFYPYTFESSADWLETFLQDRFREFGPYEDAIVAEESILHHSVLTPMLNVGLLLPLQIIERVLEFSKANDIPINTTEGFVRQVIGWREFIRGVYVAKGREERTKNFWGFKRKIPASFYDGSTGIVPVDQTIRKLLNRAYCHHIERLMILGNFMLLCEFHPDEVYRWFMELFIDAYDWVMVPNVYGMSQFADGGLMSTKPYISGSNYVRKMSDYGKGDWQEIWDGLFWRFMDKQRSFFESNPRLSMLLSTLDRMSDEKRQAHFDRAEAFLNSLG